ACISFHCGLKRWSTSQKSPSLALFGFDRNSAVGRPRIRLSLPSSEPARLQLFDAQGRLIMTRSVGSLGAGVQHVDLASEIPLPAISRSEERRVGKECRSRWWAYQ